MAGFPKGRRTPLVEGGVNAPPENSSVRGGRRSPCREFTYGKGKGMCQIFLPVFLVFGGLHYYILAKVRAAFSLGIRPTFLLILFMLVMLMAPLPRS